ncbi:glycosyl transferase family 2 [Hydrogenobacter thermophilus TK-6]|uniref:Glycosyltransferase n=1 Tax=Hydrogenobacter thermophilus (strain DSM 6534 / IAM 12695 / TK-6) TaxID=608538 RepID=D3DJU9_HYDTT|nr:polyprenol monophosphomannose synthase [Hydrogenobacter thermophilus]ADO46023.1 glycosyl transferase family 2 [Hydrogenobacter thermophilus TK-6]BAI70101.1 glycosyltransferase [Hydrogenobacter thermophilus TK-6]
MKALLVLPTYNEAQNLKVLIPKLLEYGFLDLLVVDDGSQDGTPLVVKEWSNKEPKVNLLERPYKMGLGSAYVAGFKWGLDKDYQLFFEMDADLSHDPKDIPRFVEKMKEGYHLVIGSRYTRGTISVVGWDFKRLLISKFANWYATTILGIKELTDITSGYRCYRREVLEKINLDAIKSNGYAFQIEMVYKAYRLGFKIAEIPIIFYERGSGSSKMSKKIALEAAIMVWRLKLGKA